MVKAATLVRSDPQTSPGTTCTGLEITLNSGWRVVEDDLQWMLQRNGGTKWHYRSFCRTRGALLRCIREYCGEVDPVGLMQVEALPEWHA